MKTLFLLWHLGLGDAFICNGLVRWTVKHAGWDTLVLPAKPHNVPTVGWLFSDLPQVKVVPVDNDEHARALAKLGASFALGVHTGQPIPKDWDAWFYRQANIPFGCRWSEFKLPDDAHLIPPCVNRDWVSHWCFIHDDVKRGYRITADRLPPLHEIGNYFPYQGIDMAEHAYEMQRCAEIHVIDSCFLSLADSIETSATRHVLHLYATANDPYKQNGPPTLRKNWEILR